MKENLKRIASDLMKARKTNAPTYWAMLVFAGFLINGLIVLVLTKLGLTLLVVAAFVFVSDCLIRAQQEIRQAEQSGVPKRTKAPKV